MSGTWTRGRLIAGAAALAVEMVNADMNLLPGRALKYRWADSGCSPSVGLVALGTLLFWQQTRVNAVIGPGCSSTCEVTSYLSSVYEPQGIPMISYSWCANFTSGSLSFPLHLCVLIRSASHDQSAPIG